MRFSVLQSAANDGNQRVPLPPPLVPPTAHHLLHLPPPSHFLSPLNLESGSFKGQFHETDIYFWRLTLLKMLLTIWSPSSTGNPAISLINLWNVSASGKFNLPGQEYFCLRRVFLAEGSRKCRNSRKSLVRDILHGFPAGEGDDLITLLTVYAMHILFICALILLISKLLEHLKRITGRVFCCVYY